jgi:uncharacterized protein YlzI (FlbEa/FlbD family)
MSDKVVALSSAQERALRALRESIDFSLTMSNGDRYYYGNLILEEALEEIVRRIKTFLIEYNKGVVYATYLASEVP